MLRVFGVVLSANCVSADGFVEMARKGKQLTSYVGSEKSHCYAIASTADQKPVAAELMEKVRKGLDAL